MKCSLQFPKKNPSLCDKSSFEATPQSATTATDATTFIMKKRKTLARMNRNIDKESQEKLIIAK